MGRTVNDLAGLVGGVVHGDPAVSVDDVTDDSREAGPGSLFVAVRGRSHDGHDFVHRAVSLGSPAVCVQEPMNSGAVELLVEDTRAAMGPISARVHGDPSRRLDVVGVTGTNGKTTVTHYITSIAANAGRLPGLIGTIQTRLGETVYPTERTTPEAPRFQRLLKTMQDQGADLVSVEVSSHALDMGRVAGTRFAVAAFTNLSRDHLDYHGSMDAYRQAKERFFNEYDLGSAVVNIDDPVGLEIAESIDIATLTVGAHGDFHPANITTSFDGSTFDLVTPEGTFEVITPVVGNFNIDNLTLAGAVCRELGITTSEIVAGMAEIGAVPGRLEVVSEDNPVKVVVDYAHTPEGIREAIGVARGAADGRIIALVGAGGDRDQEKRPLMGAAASGADFIVVTTDNPRSESPEAIIAEVVLGIPPELDTLSVDPDRRTAIETAIAEADAGDVVLILGKGHETGQEIGGKVFPFDDRGEVRRVLGLKPSATNSGAPSGSMSP